MFKILKNKMGEGTYIYLCVLVLVMSMLISVLVLYMGLTAQVQIQKRDMQAKLDGYIAEYAIEVFDAIKQGDSYEKYIDYGDLVNRCPGELGFNSLDRYVFSNGNCTLINPSVTELRGDGFGLVVTYTAVFPIKWGGKTFSNLEVPITISSYYKFK